MSNGTGLICAQSILKKAHFERTVWYELTLAKTSREEPQPASATFETHVRNTALTPITSEAVLRHHPVRI